ncbi:MAG: Gfo/Idh/MocA family oxidoreductase [Planctomycetaceae bacterium]|nr:Gfo/Idh/MocA family oxidoreductase [Planctomycetaceae bacterium]
MPAARQYRVAVIGATGQGNYGHGLDTAFMDVKQAEIVAVVDPDAAGRAAAGKRLKVDRLFADYRQMLDAVRPDIVCIGPRWTTDRVAMVQAAASAGCHMYCEKPFAGTLAEADAMQAACRAAKVQLAMAHQWRAMPPVQEAIRRVRAGEYGRLLRIFIRPKDDSRGGGEELILHGTHLFDLMLAFAGFPQWVAGHVQVQGRDALLSDAGEASEPVGPVAGDTIDARYGFARGVQGCFTSTAGLSGRKPADGSKPRFDNLYGVRLECERALLHLRQPGDVFIYPAPEVLPDLTELKWEQLWIEDWHFTADHQPRNHRRTWLRTGNQVLAEDLIQAIERNRPPLSPIEHAVQITEMVQGTYASHFAEGRRLPLPLADRQHPLSGS